MAEVMVVVVEHFVGGRVVRVRPGLVYDEASRLNCNASLLLIQTKQDHQNRWPRG